MDDIIYINNELSYSRIKNCYVIHNLDEAQTENLLDNLDIGSWILRTDNKQHAITIKINDGFIHHNGFIFESNFKIYIMNKSNIIKKTFETMHEYLLYLSNIYGLDIDKQIIYEND